MDAYSLATVVVINALQSPVLPPSLTPNIPLATGTWINKESMVEVTRGLLATNINESRSLNIPQGIESASSTPSTRRLSRIKEEQKVQD